MTAAYGAWPFCQAVDLAADSVYLPARNLVFGFILLSRSRLWASCSS